MSLSRVEDVAFVGFQAPDLQQMRVFLEDFGLQLAEQRAHRLFMRGSGPAPFLHMTVQGDPGFAVLGLRVGSPVELARLAEADGVAVEDHDAPGGGGCVELRDPDGHRVVVVAGQTAVEPIAAAVTQRWNSSSARTRVREPKRLSPGPAKVMRIGHCVLNVSDFRASEAWYKSRFGFITSDEIALSPELSVGAFLRCDRGEEPTDHHTLFLAQSPGGPGFNHAAFEVADMDDLLNGHDRLSAAGHPHVWGVGRHLLGSQVFDYWRDPWGHTLEHWTDGDVFTAADAPRTASLAELLAVQWGPSMPPEMT